MTQVSPEPIIKGRIAEHLVELLLSESDYKVVRIAYEGLLVNISREDASINKSKAAGRLTTAPSFAVFDKKGRQVALIKIKFRSATGSGRNIAHGMGQLLEYWPESHLIVVTNERPYFRVVLEDGSEYAIEDLFSHIKKTALASFGEMMEKFLKK